MDLPERIKNLEQIPLGLAAIVMLIAILIGVFMLSLLGQAGFDVSYFTTISSANTTRAGRILATHYNPFAFLMLGALIAAAISLICFAAAYGLPLLNRAASGGMGSASPVAAVSKLVDETREALKGELSVVLEKLRAHLAINEEYAKKLTLAQQRLADLTEPEQVRVVVKLLVDENERIRKETVSLRDQLKASDVEIDKLKGKLAAAEEEGQRDGLTGVSNRKAFDTIFDTAVQKAAQSGLSFSLIMCDIDHFKNVNDTYGHTVGDEVIKMFAKTLNSNVRAGSVVARFGGEEFSILLPGIDLETAAAVAERMRTSFSEKRLTMRASGKQIAPVTASFGVAEFAKGESGKSLLERADAKLYDAKQSGRNRVSS